MLSGVKFIPRDQINTPQDENLEASTREKKRSSTKKEKDSRKNKSSHYSSSEEEELERISKGSGKKNKWYSSEEQSSPFSTESEGSRDRDKKKRGRKIKGKKTYEDSSRSKKRSKRAKKYYSSEEYSSSTSENEGGDKKESRIPRKRKSKERDGSPDYGRESNSISEKDNARKEMGLDWMLKQEDKIERKVKTIEPEPEEPQPDETQKTHPRELNPFLKDSGSGYPEEKNQTKARGPPLLSSSVVGDGGASWRLKALKRAKEQAAREGRKLDEVVEERWGSLGHLAVSVASRAAAPSYAHLHAIKSRKKVLTGESETVVDDQNKMDVEKKNGRDYLRDVSVRHPEMRAPKVHDSQLWRNRKSNKDAVLISDTLSSLNKFANDGSFMREVTGSTNTESGGSSISSLYRGSKVESELIDSEPNKPSEKDSSALNQPLSANQLAAKVLQLRMKGKHEEADKLSKEVEKMRAEQDVADELNRQRNKGQARRYAMHEASVKQKKNEEDADLHLAATIAKNKKYTLSGRADDEYDDFEDGPSRKSRKKRHGNDGKSDEKKTFVGHILTQQERCKFCFENQTRPKHLVISIANFTYLMLPPSQPVVPGHCCILPMQHESSTRAADDNVWEEIRNFKKCLIMMFSKQDKDVIFLETVMGLAQQRRHCLVECIPVPQKIAKQAPLYFKKAIDEAEDEWSQHNAKRLIDTSEKGLRASIPKEFPYFHVEFGLSRGFVHVIDDETQFKSNLGLNVIRGMLCLPEEDMYRRRQQDSLDSQKQAVSSFVQDWDPFDWTKQLQ